MISNKDNDTLKEIQEYLKIKVEPLDEINLEHEKLGEWDFFYNCQKMLSGKELDMISDKMKVNRLPDMFYGYNRFYVVNKGANFCLEINPLDMIDLTSYAERNNKFMPVEKIQKGLFDPTKDDPNFIYYQLPDVKVQYYDKWKDMKIERDDVQKVDPTSDWTFNSPYMGQIGKLSDNKLFISNSKHFEDFDLLKKYPDFDIKPTDEELPVNRLGQDNPIIKYMEVNLYEDELCDNGLSQGNFR
jgi:type 2A phosphatase activator TIP41